MGNEVSNVTAGKPEPTGAIFRAPVGTTLPTSTETELDTTVWKCLGFCSDDGIKNSGEMDSENIKAWGGQTVLTTSTSTDDKFHFKLIEALNEEVKKFIYGNANVSGSLADGIAVEVSGYSQEDSSIVIDMIMRNNTKHRIVIPSATIAEVGEIAYVDNDAVGYDITLSCATDSDGKTHYEYTKRTVANGSIVPVGG